MYKFFFVRLQATQSDYKRHKATTSDTKIYCCVVGESHKVFVGNKELHRRVLCDCFREIVLNGLFLVEFESLHHILLQKNAKQRKERETNLNPLSSYGKGKLNYTYHEFLYYTRTDFIHFSGAQKRSKFIRYSCIQFTLIILS